MISLASRAMPFVMTIRGSKRQFSSAEATLARVEALRLRPRRFAPPRGLERSVRISVRTVGGWPVYEVGPRGPATGRAIYLHGGAYVYQIAVQHWRLVAELARMTATRFTVPIFPLAPASTAGVIVPAVADLAAALVQEVGAARTTVMGDSAGGGMALAVSMQLRDRGSPSPRVILISPWLDISGTDPQLAVIAPRDPWLAVPGSHAAGLLYAGDLGEDDPLVSPINGDLRGLGPITMFSGTRDILNADAHRLLERAARAGVAIDYREAGEMIHVWPLLPTPEANSARRAIRDVMLRA